MCGFFRLHWSSASLHRVPRLAETSVGWKSDTLGSRHWPLDLISCFHGPSGHTLIITQLIASQWNRSTEIIYSKLNREKSKPNIFLYDFQVCYVNLHFHYLFYGGNFYHSLFHLQTKVVLFKKSHWQFMWTGLYPLELFQLSSGSPRVQLTKQEIQY